MPITNTGNPIIKTISGSGHTKIPSIHSNIYHNTQQMPAISSFLQRKKYPVAKTINKRYTNLKIPMGDLLEYVHAEDEDKYEREIILTIKKGEIISLRMWTNWRSILRLKDKI